MQVVSCMQLMKPMRKSLLLISGLLAFSLSLNSNLRATGQEAAMDLGENSAQAKRSMLIDHVNRGNRMMAAKQYQAALAEYDAAKKLEPNNPIVRQNIAECRNNMGIQLFRSHHFADAIVQFEKCLKVSPNHSQARRNIALCQQTMDQLGVYDAPSADEEDDAESKQEKTAKSEQKAPEDTSPKVVGGSDPGMSVSSGGQAMFSSGSSLYPTYSTQGSASSKRTVPTIPVTKPPKLDPSKGTAATANAGVPSSNAAAASGSNANSNAASSNGNANSAFANNGGTNAASSAPAESVGPHGVSAGQAFEPVVPGTLPTISQPPESPVAQTPERGSSPNQAALAAGYAPATDANSSQSNSSAAQTASSKPPSQAEAFLNALAKEQQGGMPTTQSPALASQTPEMGKTTASAQSSSSASSQTSGTLNLNSQTSNLNSQASSSTPGAAEASLEDKVGSLEQKVYGKKNDHLPILKRIEQLEVDYIGQSRQGSLSERVENLRKQILHN